MVQTVCFDVGGVLLQINHKWSGAITDVGLPPDLAERFDVLLTGLEPFNTYQTGGLTDDEYLSELGKYLGVPSEQAAAIHNAILRSTYPGISDLIDDLHERGYQTGCLSNTNAPHWKTFFTEPRLEALMKIRVPIASHLIGAEKPDPAMYKAFEEASGAKPQEIVYFDDGLINVEAAQRLGWTAFHVDPDGDTAFQMRAKLKEIEWL